MLARTTAQHPYMAAGKGAAANPTFGHPAAPSSHHGSDNGSAASSQPLGQPGLGSSSIPYSVSRHPAMAISGGVVERERAAGVLEPLQSTPGRRVAASSVAVTQVPHPHYNP